jgi:regulatory protein
VKHELRSHGIDDALVRAAVSTLASTEFERARAVWQRRFEQPPANLAERAKHMRFLAQRGFSTEVIRRVLRGSSGAHPDDGSDACSDDG